MGNLASGKSALVHRYLTGTYVQEESPEGRCFAIKWQVKYGESLKAFVLLYLSLSLSCAILLTVYITHFNAFERLYNGVCVSCS